MSEIASSNAAIVIPIYKEFDNLSKTERKLLSKIKNVFVNRKIFIVLPKSLNKSFQSYEQFQAISFDDYFFENKFSYSKLLCRKEFYQAFNNFDYVQLIQPDCWVFEDKINHFANLGLDYIGAPWMEGGFDGFPQKKLWKVGNGGFSLRRVKTFLSILDEIENSPKGRMRVFNSHKKGMVGIIKNFGIRNNLKHYIKEAPGEDIFWTHYIPQVFSEKDFKIADPITGARYSFEVHPRFLFEKVTNGKLPMGCHNWRNNEPDFWSSYIHPIKESP